MLARPYEPPPDYPMIEERWTDKRKNNQNKNSNTFGYHKTHSSPATTHRSHSIDTAVNRSASSYLNPRPSYHQSHQRRHEFPICGVSPRRAQDYYDPFFRQHNQHHDEMLRTRQFPEIAGIYANEEQPALRRFTRYNQSISGKNGSPIIMDEPMTGSAGTTGHSSQKSNNGGSIFSKSSKKPLFFMGNWTFRERNKSGRPTISDAMREDRPQSMNLSDARTSRSKSGDTIGARSKEFPFGSPGNRTSIIIGESAAATHHHHEFPRNTETRIPVRIERSSMVRRKPSTSTEGSIPSPSSSSSGGEFKTNITVDDEQIVLRPKKDVDNVNNSMNIKNNNNNNRFSFQSCVQLRKSCPDLDTSTMSNMEQHRVSKKRTRRAKEKMTMAAWKKKTVSEWSLDDVLLWLQSSQMDEVASLLIGYDLRGEDILQWNDQTLAQLGVGNVDTRQKLLDELKKIVDKGPEAEEPPRIASNHKTLFDIVKQTSYDQVLAVETPLTTRDITVTHGRLGCLQITKVNGANLPLKGHDCLLEINERPGEQFKSALMLTKLISDSNGTPIRFVVLRRKTDTMIEESVKETSSSGISSSPQTPNE